MLSPRSQSDLARLDAERVDLILLDLVLGEEDGLELLPRLPERTTAPILVLSGYGTRENVLRAIRAKPDEFLEKPIDLLALRSRVETYLHVTRDVGKWCNVCY